MTILKVAGKETKNSLMRMFTTESLNCYSSLKNYCLHLNFQIAGMTISGFLFDDVIFYSFRKVITILPTACS